MPALEMRGSLVVTPRYLRPSPTGPRPFIFRLRPDKAKKETARFIMKRQNQRAPPESAQEEEEGIDARGSAKETAQDALRSLGPVSNWAETVQGPQTR